MSAFLYSCWTFNQWRKAVERSKANPTERYPQLVARYWQARHVMALAIELAERV